MRAHLYTLGSGATAVAVLGLLYFLVRTQRRLGPTVACNGEPVLLPWDWILIYGCPLLLAAGGLAMLIGAPRWRR